MSLVLVLDRVEGKYSKILFKENSLTYDFRVLNDLLIEEHSVSIEKIPIEDNLETSYILVLFPSKTAAAEPRTWHESLASQVAIRHCSRTSSKQSETAKLWQCFR